MVIRWILVVFRAGAMLKLGHELDQRNIHEGQTRVPTAHEPIAQAMGRRTRRLLR